MQHFGQARLAPCGTQEAPAEAASIHPRCYEGTRLKKHASIHPCSKEHPTSLMLKNIKGNFGGGFIISIWLGSAAPRWSTTRSVIDISPHSLINRGYKTNTGGTAKVGNNKRLVGQFLFNLIVFQDNDTPYTMGNTLHLLSRASTSCNFLPCAAPDVNQDPGRPPRPGFLVLAPLTAQVRPTTVMKAA